MNAAPIKVLVIDDWGFDAPSTKAAAAALSTLGVSGRSLVVVDPADLTARKSVRNIPEVHVIAPGELNTYDVLVSDFVVFTEATLPGATTGATETEAAS